MEVPLNLPEQYLKKMKDLLGTEYDDWRSAMEEPAVTGLRTNDLKTDPGEFLNILARSGFSDMPDRIPWIHNGFFTKDSSLYSKHPLYQTGVYYIQEPSAMTPAELLPVSEGEYVLDLCAAPGGKACQLLQKLNGRGLLYANDLSASRAQALKKNLEMAGAVNAYVTAEEPAALASHFQGYFDKILVDAPCSGEGMFRREPSMASFWMKKGPEYYQPIQLEILRNAWRMLRPGGMMLFSTCTFSPLENEGNVERLLTEFPDLHLVEIPDHPGFARGITLRTEECVRLYPHRLCGEGQFAALFQKEGSAEFRTYTGTQIYEKNGEIYLIPSNAGPVPGLRYLLTGLHTGTRKRERIAAAQGLAQAISGSMWPKSVNLSCTDERISRYLRGETIFCGPSEIMEGGPCPLLSPELTEAQTGLLLRDSSDDRLHREQRDAAGRKKARRGKGKVMKFGDRTPTADPDRKRSGAEFGGMDLREILILADGFPVGFADPAANGMLKNRRNPGWRT